jgi:hypothetical protein
VAVVQYTFTHKKYTEQHNETEYTEQNIHNNKNKIHNNILYTQCLRFSCVFVMNDHTCFEIFHTKYSGHIKSTWQSLKFSFIQTSSETFCVKLCKVETD